MIGGKSKGQFKEVYTLRKDPVCISFSKKALGSNRKIWSDKVNKIMLQVKKEGFVQETIDKYLKSTLLNSRQGGLN